MDDRGRSTGTVTAGSPLDPLTVTLIEAFEAGALEPASFRHRDHVRVAWGMVRRVGLVETLARYPAALKRFAELHGAAERYHETVTWAFLLLVHERMVELGEGHDWDEFEGKSDDLLGDHRVTLRRYYPADRLDSEVARRTFVLPLPPPRDPE